MNTREFFSVVRVIGAVLLVVSAEKIVEWLLTF